jgi:hypothetical protein
VDKRQAPQKSIKSCKAHLIALQKFPHYPHNEQLNHKGLFSRRRFAEAPLYRPEWCIEAISHPFRRETQPDGRIRHWIFVDELDRYLRVVTLEDGVTVHNTFPDRSFKP